MSDSAGTLPKWLKEIGARLKYIGKFALGVTTAPLKSFKAEFGMGIGIGAKGSANIEGVKIEGGLSTSITDSLSYDKGKFDIKNTTSTKAGITVIEVLDFSYTSGKSHSFFDEECGCDIMHDPFVEQSKCPANIEFEQTDVTLGVSFGLFLGLGAEISAGIDLRALYDELHIVLTEPYVSPYY
jgi:hypothetical protein